MPRKPKAKTMQKRPVEGRTGTCERCGRVHRISDGTWVILGTQELVCYSKECMVGKE